jgi:hypothetical protein
MTHRCYVSDCKSSPMIEAYGSCQNCYKFTICSKQDPEHYNSLLYNEGCRSHHSGGYSICLNCALEAYQKKMYGKYEAGEERCMCPHCDHDFGLLKDLPGAEPLVNLLESCEGICSIEGCVPFYPIRNGYMNDMSYGWCQCCEEFSVCYRGMDTPDHDAALLYNEDCRSHDSGGYSICIPCASKAYKNLHPESTEIHCICPICSHDFGLLTDLDYSLKTTSQ